MAFPDTNFIPRVTVITDEWLQAVNDRLQPVTDIGDVALKPELSASSGASLVGYLPAGTGGIATTVQTKLRESVSIIDKGASSSGAVDILSALNSLATDFSTGGYARMPKGTYLLSSGFTFAGQRIHLEGDGQNVTSISYSPASPGTALTLNNVSAGGLYQGSIKNIGFFSSNSIAKTAISLVNTADCELSGIGIPSGSWLGDSIGIRTYGRQTLRVSNCQIACARPVVFSQNATYTSLNTDHYLVEHCELSSTDATRAAIEFESGVMHTNTTLRNLALTGGKYGILWNDTTSVGASYALSIENIRIEQAADATGWSIDLESASQNLQSVSIKNVITDASRNGIKLRNANRVILENVQFQQTAATGLDITMVAGSSLLLINCWFQTGAAKTITNGRCIKRSGTSNSGHTVEEWVYNSAAHSGSEVSETFHHGTPLSMASDATAIISANTATGILFISSSEDVSAVFSLMGPTNQTRELLDPDGFFSVTKNTASSYNIYYETGNYYIQNKRGLTTTVSIYRILTLA